MSAKKDHLDAVASLGCIVMVMTEDGPRRCERNATIHHTVSGSAYGKKSGYLETLPLCPEHHQGPYGIGFHSGAKIWQEIFGRERDLLAEVLDLLDIEGMKG